MDLRIQSVLEEARAMITIYKTVNSLVSTYIIIIRHIDRTCTLTLG
jgi:hypothetical protein